jgi:hypothetical protein
MKLLVASFLGLVICGRVVGQEPEYSEQVIDRITTNEKALIESWTQYTPIAETYIQELAPHGEKLIVARDHYFLNQAVIGPKIGITEFKGTRKGNRVAHLAADVFNVGMEYLPAGFVSMVHPSLDDFDRTHYSFKFRRSETFNSTECLIFDVTPLRTKGTEGMFEGEIWVETTNYAIVRYRGIFRQAGNLAAMIRGYYFRFDTSRFYARQGLWLPASTYSEEFNFEYNKVGYEEDSFSLGHNRFRAQTRFWGYEGRPTLQRRAKVGVPYAAPQFEPVELHPVRDNSDQNLEAESENNVLERLAQIGLLAPPGEWDHILEAVVEKLNTIKHRQVQPKVHCRELLTTRLEFFTIGHTIVVSRGLLDIIPNEPILAGVLALALARMELMYPPNTTFAFADRILFDPQDVFLRMNFASPPKSRRKIAELAAYYISRSPYRDSLPSIQSFSAEIEDLSSRFPELLEANIGDSLLPELSYLQPKAPTAMQNRLSAQDRTLPLGSRTTLDPQTDILEVLHFAVDEEPTNEATPLEITTRPFSEGRQKETVLSRSGSLELIGELRPERPGLIGSHDVSPTAARFMPATDRVAFTSDNRPKLLMGGGFGVDNQLGYKFPTLTLTTGIERPFAHRFEAQADANFSGTRKFITGDGHSTNIGASLIFWAKKGIGLIGSGDRSWLWTSQFNKTNFFPSAGIVLRGLSLGPGRIYITYMMPTGCVRATSTSPCAIQSNRLQGVAFREEDQVRSRVRLGFGFSVLRSCDQGNPYAPQVERNCHIAFTMSGDFRFVLPIAKHRNHEAHDYY